MYCGTDPSSEELQKMTSFVEKQKTLIVASSDFCHYGNRFGYAPVFAGKTAQETVDELNMAAFEAMKVSAEAFRANLEDTDNTICGRHTIFTGLELLKKGYHAEIKSYTRSSILKNNKDSSVSYMGIIIE